MKCRACHDRLQNTLDERRPDALAAVDVCPACADWFAAASRLNRGLGLLTPPVPPADLAGRIVGRVMADRRARRRRRLLLTAGFAALAASLLLPLLAYLAGTGTPRPPAPRPPAAVDPEPVAAPTLRDTATEAGSAVASLTTRTADQTVEQTRMFFPVMADPAMGTIDLQPSLDPPARSLREAGEGVSAGLEPVTTSARRAVGLFLHDLPPVESGQ